MPSKPPAVAFPKNELPLYIPVPLKILQRLFQIQAIFVSHETDSFHLLPDSVPNIRRLAIGERNNTNFCLNK
jgi:hypothetical protein